MEGTRKEVRITDSKQKTCCCENASTHCQLVLLVLATVTGAALGVVLRLFVPTFQQPGVRARDVALLYFPAEIFLRFVGLLTLPLVVSGLVSGIGAVRAKSSGKIVLRVVCYYLLTTILAILEGFVFVYAIRPGKDQAQANMTSQASRAVQYNVSSKYVVDMILDMIRNLVPDNGVKISHYEHDILTTYRQISTNSSFTVDKYDTMACDIRNIIGVCVLSVTFGLGLSVTGGKGRLLFCVFDAIYDICLQIVKATLWIYPLGLAFMVATTVVQMENPEFLLKHLYIYIITVLLALFTHLFLVLPVLFLVFARKNPLKHMWYCLRAIVTAFGTDNSIATVPVSLTCLENSGYSSSVTRFMIPIGAVFNMDGLALYQATAAVFVGTRHGISLGPVEGVILGSALLAVSFVPALTGSRAVAYAVVFQILGLPLEDIMILISLDWLLGRLCTVASVWSDCVGVGIVERLSHLDLYKTPVVADCVSHSSGDELEDDPQPVLTSYSKLGHKDWTVRLINENGDSIFVSKV